MNKSMVQTIVSLFIIIGVSIGAVNYFASRGYVDIQDMIVKAGVKDVSLRLDQKILSDRIWQIKTWMFQLEDRHGGTDCSLWKNKTDKTTYRQLIEQLKQLEAKYNSIFKKK